MNDIINARVNVIKRLNVMAKRIEDTASFLIVGADDCQPGEINAVLAAADAFSIDKLYNDLDFLIKTFLQPSGSTKNDEDGGCFTTYSFNNGITLNVNISDENSYPEADWYVSYMDKTGSAEAFYSSCEKYNSDPVVDGIIPKEEEEPDFDDGLDDGLDDDLDDIDDIDDTVEEVNVVPEVIVTPEPDLNVFKDNAMDDGFAEVVPEPVQKAAPEPVPAPAPAPAPEPVPVPVPEPVPAPVPVPVPVPAPEPAVEEAKVSRERPEPTPDEMWEYIYSRVGVAKRAVSGGSIFYAIEIVNELRNEIVKIICKKNGIDSDYYRSIDLLSNDYRKALSRTYPASAESGAVVAALAAELAMFEQLI